jgi:hypothetical protein
MKPSKPFNISGMNKASIFQDEETLIPKFPETSGRRTPYNMGARPKLRRDPVEDNTSIPVSLLLE